MSKETEPKLLTDVGLDEHVARSVHIFDGYIRDNPGRAAIIITMFSKNFEGDDNEPALLTDVQEARAQLRLTAALGSTANRDTIRHISFDDTTEERIAGTQRVKELLGRMKGQISEEEKETLSREIGLLRLSIYADRLAVAATAAATDPETNEFGEPAPQTA